MRKMTKMRGGRVRANAVSQSSGFSVVGCFKGFLVFWKKKTAEEKVSRVRQELENWGRVSYTHPD